MTDTPPDRLSSNPRSPFFNEELLSRGIGIRFKGVSARMSRNTAFPKAGSALRSARRSIATASRLRSS